LDSFLLILSGFLKTNNPDWIIIKEISMILIKQEEKSPKLNSLIKCMIFILIKSFGTKDSEWYCSCE
jgi:hypothetical protein